MNYKVKTPVGAEPVALSALKLHLKVDTNADDTLLADLIVAAREWVEGFTGRAVKLQTYELYLDSFPASAIVLPVPPLASVASIKYKDSANVEHTISSSDYIVDTDSSVGKILPAYGVSWPSFTAYPVNPIRITFNAGYSSVPQRVIEAMLLLMGEWYANRESSTTSIEALAAVKNLLTPLRVRWWD